MGTKAMSFSVCSETDGVQCWFLWSKLPSEVWFEILSRVTSLDNIVQLRCVSKAFCYFITDLFIPKFAPISGFVFQWKTIFVDPEYCYFLPSKLHPDPRLYLKYSPSLGCEKGDFVTEYFHDYVNISPNNDHGEGCFRREFITWYASLLPFKMSETTTDEFLGCFNGFILVTNNNSTPSSKDDVFCCYYLCNPATKQCISIPINPAHLKLEKDSSFVGLAFDPLDPPPHHFKIVRFTHPTEEIDVFSSTTGKWIKHAIHLDDPDDEILISHFVRRCVYLNGVLYLLSTAKYLLCFDLQAAYNNCIDANKVKARAIKLPYTSSSARYDNYLGLFDASNRCLYYAYPSENDLIVWTFQVNSRASPWILKYRISIDDLRKLPKGCSFHFCFSPCIIYAVDLREEIIFFGDCGLVRSYNIKTNKINYICRLDSGDILGGAEKCFYSYSCCLIKLSDRFSLEDKVVTEPRPLSLTPLLP